MCRLVFAVGGRVDVVCQGEVDGSCVARPGGQSTGRCRPETDPIEREEGNTRTAGETEQG